jgi:anti-sigma factor RsiW
MNCKFDEKILHLYADGELGETARARVEHHLAICQDCRARYESIIFIKEQMHEACSMVKAPEYLKTRVTASINSIEPAKILNFGFLERFTLAITKFKPSRVVTLGFLFSIVMLFVLFPGKRGLSKIAGDLAEEFMAWPERGAIESISTNNPNEAEAYFIQKLDINSKIPALLAGGMKLIGAGIADLNGQPVAHARYSDGSMECSMFIFRQAQPGYRPSSTLMVAGREYEISSSAEVNLLCWHKNEMNYVLCGCCCFEKLSELAISSI